MSVDGPEICDRLTVVILSRSRPDYLARQLAYWARVPARVLIMDGSDEPLGSATWELAESLGHVDYRYRPASIPERLREAADALETEYAVMLGDDEFHLPHGLSTAIQRLDEDPFLAGCIGQSLYHRLMGSGTTAVFERAYPHWRYSRREPNPIDRFNAAFDPYTPATPYAVLRRNVWRDSWGRLEDWSCPAAMEVQQAMVVLAHGHVEAIDAVQWLRSFENERVDDSARKLTFVPWLRLEESADEFGRWKASVANLVALAGGVDASVAESWVDAGVEAYGRYFDWRQQTVPPTAFQKIDSIWAGTKVRSLSLLRRVADDRQILRFRQLRVAVGDRLGWTPDGYLGSPDEVDSRADSALLEAHPRLAEDLAGIQSFIATFQSERSAIS